MMWIHAIWIGLVLAVLFELLTVALRFGLGWRSPDRTRPLGRLTRGWRVHHGYPGLLMMPAAKPACSRWPRSARCSWPWASCWRSRT
jgi:hypothetical protein